MSDYQLPLDKMTYKVPPGYALGLAVVYADGTPVLDTHWNLEVGATITGCLQLWAWGQGVTLSSNICHRSDTVWMAVEYEIASAEPLEEGIKVPQGKIVFLEKTTGDSPPYTKARSSAATFIWKHAPPEEAAQTCFAKAEVGEYDMVAVGDFGEAIAGVGGCATVGNYGNALAGDKGYAHAGEGGFAQAGDRGEAIAGAGGVAIAGHKGRALVGKGGTAIAGDGSWVRVGVGGMGKAGVGGVLYLAIGEYEGGYRTLHVGEDGIKPYTYYRLDNLTKQVMELF